MDITVKGIVSKDDKFLLLKQKADDEWWYSLPGGRAQNSDLESELKREIKEEVGLDIEVLKYIGDWFFIRQSNRVKTICKTFVCKPISGKLNSSDAEEYEDINDFIWVTKEEFLNGNYTNNKSLLNLLKKAKF